MTMTIAVAGKGGTGKTTFCGLLIRYLVAHKGGKILAIDADPSSNLHLVLGMNLTQTVGDIREDARTGVAPGQTRQDFLDYAVRMAVEEGDDFDLLAMGRPEGQGCYCAANHMLRGIMDGINRGYDWVVMDNEAGMEHLSRRTTRDVDHLILISDASLRGMVAAESMVELRKALEIQVRNTHLIVNRVQGELSPALRARIENMGVPLLAALPYDPLITEYDSQGRALVELPDDALISRAVAEVARQLVG
ncbi:MAG: protochlorophyllide reductase iron-sulfur ATP-binding protein [Chloroflexi bacterium ADurb.Bin325]|nr:MAG: protochlorophyllide reductase iron-sulfur ATP-binding protein [Chloroflexi bacterium ADurb.Bin325]